MTPERKAAIPNMRTVTVNGYDIVHNRGEDPTYKHGWYIIGETIALGPYPTLADAMARVDFIGPKDAKARLLRHEEPA